MSHWALWVGERGDNPSRARLPFVGPFGLHAPFHYFGMNEAKITLTLTLFNFSELDFGVGCTIRPKIITCPTLIVSQ